MARVKGALSTRKRHKKILKLAKGYRGAKSKLYRIANQAVMKSLTYSYTGRKLKKRDFRSLWITRISAACKMNGINYSRFMNGLKKANIEINRKMLSEIAINDPAAFTQLVETAKAIFRQMIKTVSASRGGGFLTERKNFRWLLQAVKQNIQLAVKLASRSGREPVRIICG